MYVIDPVHSDWQQGIYALTDAALLPDDDILLSRAEAALAGGLALLQYRDKSDDAVKRRRQASALAVLCRDYGTPLIINDDVVLAEQLNVGVHLGREDGSIAQARERLGPDAIIGATCHARLDLAVQAAREGASYLAFGRFFVSKTKPHAPPAELSVLREAGYLGLPRVAIGGISASNAPQAFSAGAELVAVVHAVFGHDDPKSAVETLKAGLIG
ncbi:thiamine phosphate synthase [Phytohalomonas tamaricis]|uniref:thiamine phosphate synthase n=1 Tax=Phytohalomonas tamaricis TaxID=2081032 RepID=UPI0021D41AAF|nr:thiamine phosphate synthase [Phytohalomonas tamaricis]